MKPEKARYRERRRKICRCSSVVVLFALVSTSLKESPTSKEHAYAFSIGNKAPHRHIQTDWPSRGYLLANDRQTLRDQLEGAVSRQKCSSRIHLCRMTANDDEQKSPQYKAKDAESAIQDALAAHAASSQILLGTKSIGVDYGLVRTGLAATIGYDMRPLRIVSNLNNTELCSEIISAVKSESADRVVVGLPLHKNGTESERSNLTRMFSDELASESLAQLGPDFGGVYLWDERYTSKEAKARIMSANSDIRSGEELDGTIDAEAACLILEHYYRADGVDAELVEVPDGPVHDSCMRRWNLEKERLHNAKQETLQKREESLNARQAMMARVKAMEAENSNANESGTGGARKGKKKKKKKKK